MRKMKIKKPDKSDESIQSEKKREATEVPLASVSSKGIWSKRQLVVVGIAVVDVDRELSNQVRVSMEVRGRESNECKERKLGLSTGMI